MLTPLWTLGCRPKKHVKKKEHQNADIPVKQTDDPRLQVWTADTFKQRGNDCHSTCARYGEYCKVISSPDQERQFGCDDRQGSRYGKQQASNKAEMRRQHREHVRQNQPERNATNISTAKVI